MFLWISLEKFIHVKEKNENFKRCQSIFQKVYLAKLKATPIASGLKVYLCLPYFNCSLKNIKDINFQKKLKSHKLNDIESMILKDINYESKHFSRFLDTSFPNKVDRIWIPSKDYSKSRSSRNFNRIIKISSRVLKSAGFRGFIFNFRQFKRLITSYKLVRSLVLQKCDLSIPEIPDFSSSLKNAKIEMISLIASHFGAASYGSNDHDQIINLVEGVASSPDLCRALEEIDLRDCSIPEGCAQQARQILSFTFINVLV
ncbi:unnamed protein product [Moneuplotes crassus]|uniref:Uncharacterized protein n=1 Tax=Euplotes crassus TaxID=5936 RepID=A0AAD2CXB2_EUPCR|nr:unnamed protein product [Moneuplotes crassus]